MIRLENIDVTYGRGSVAEIRALCLPFLEIESGTWCNMIGPNGSGKTTLLKVLSGGVELNGGSVIVNGRDMTKWKARQRATSVQLLEQSPARNTVPSMTIEENLRLYAQNGRLPSFSFLAKKSADGIKHLLQRFDMELERRLSTPVRLLSGGQMQAVALAAVLLRAPEVLLLDEFLASIDPKSSPRLLAVVREAASAQGITVLMVSHDLTHVEATGDRLIILSNGQVADDIGTKYHALSQSEIITRYSAILEKNGAL